jgi:osmotically-inducible protein OsmY
MSTNVVSHTLRELVQTELAWDPQVKSHAIGVTSDGGAVSLTGFVGSYAEKAAAERDALRVVGTTAVANDLVVRLDREWIDPEIAVEAATALRLNLNVPTTVKATVHNGYVSLEGTCEWNFQRDAAAQTVAHLGGVRGVVNHIAITPHVSAGAVKARIEDAIARSAEVDAKAVTVSGTGSTVRLGGTVRSHAERLEAERVAWAAPGVTSVENAITVGR